MNLNACYVLLLCGFSAWPVSAATQLDLSRVENRKQVIAERKGIDCGGIYKQTQLKLDAVLKLSSKLEVSVGWTPQVLAQLTTMTAALGQKRREFCELYRSTPEWNTEEYFRTYGEMSKLDSDIDAFLQAMVGEAGKSQSQPQKFSALSEKLATISVSPDDTADDVAERLRIRVDLAGLPSTSTTELQEEYRLRLMKSLVAQENERLALSGNSLAEYAAQVRPAAGFSGLQLCLAGLLGLLVGSLLGVRIFSKRKAG